MSAWLMDADRAVSLPATAVTSLFIVHFGAETRSGRSRDPGYDLCAAQSPQRPGPYRTLARFPDDDEGRLEAAAALEALAMLLANEPDGVIVWNDADSEWAFLMDIDADAIAD